MHEIIDTPSFQSQLGWCPENEPCYSTNNHNKYHYYHYTCYYHYYHFVFQCL